MPTPTSLIEIPSCMTQGYDLSINRYKEVVHEEVIHRSPQEILADSAKLEKEIQTGMKDLEAMLK